MAKANKVESGAARFAPDGLDALFEEIESSELYEVESAKSDLARAIAERMERMEISRAELARRLGKSRAYVTQFLAGKTNFSIETLVRVARALECRYEDLVAAAPRTSTAAPLASADAAIQVRLLPASAIREAPSQSARPILRCLKGRDWITETRNQPLFLRAEGAATPCEEAASEASLKVA